MTCMGNIRVMLETILDTVEALLPSLELGTQK